MSSKITIVYKNIDELHEYENNPRLNDDAVDVVANSIKEFGWKVPIVIDKDNTIVTGHTRIKAARKLGITQIPCIVATDLSPSQIKAYRLADNSAAEKSGWDMSKLDMELKDLKDIFCMEDFGFVDYEALDSNFFPEEQTEQPVAEPQFVAGETPDDDYPLIIHCFSEIDRDNIMEAMEQEGRPCRRL